MDDFKLRYESMASKTSVLKHINAIAFNLEVGATISKASTLIAIEAARLVPVSLVKV